MSDLFYQMATHAQGMLTARSEARQGRACGHITPGQAIMKAAGTTASTTPYDRVLVGMLREMPRFIGADKYGNIAWTKPRTQAFHVSVNIAGRKIGSYPGLRSRT